MPGARFVAKLAFTMGRLSASTFPCPGASAFAAGLFAAFLGMGGSLPAQDRGLGYANLDAPEHAYWTRELHDPFTRLKADIEAGKLPLDYSSEKACLVSLLKHLEIPIASQLWVFSTTSLQLRYISPENPRALYFNENVYLGYIPKGGRIEIVSLDPEVGGVFYIFDLPQDGRPPIVERSNRCMNCHSAGDTRQVPGLVVKSVVPGPTGGTLRAFRQEQSGHAIPFIERFGGWHVTGIDDGDLGDHWGNATGRYNDEGKIVRVPNAPGQRFDVETYPVPTSDILPHLLHEHQTGFVTRAVEASYRARTLLKEGGGKFRPPHRRELEAQADTLIRYLLFKDEVPLPKGGIDGDPLYKEQFLATRKATRSGQSLKDFDLRGHLFKHRCSYMIYSNAFAGLPALFKQGVYLRLGQALDTAKPNPEYAYLSASEKQAIRAILKETLPDLPSDW